MADIADMVLQDVIHMEGLRDSYVSGQMSIEEAYDLGFVNPTGNDSGQLQEAWDRYEILTPEDIDKEMFITGTLLKTINSPPKNMDIVKNKTLSKKALSNLKKQCPTCNICEQQMTPREGKYGKFYFCSNKCEGQGTVSDTYWQSVKK